MVSDKGVENKNNTIHLVVGLVINIYGVSAQPYCWSCLSAHRGSP